MRYRCWFCEKSVTTDLPGDAIIRAILVCPECIQAGKIALPDPADRAPDDALGESTDG